MFSQVSAGGVGVGLGISGARYLRGRVPGGVRVYI